MAFWILLAIWTVFGLPGGVAHYWQLRTATPKTPATAALLYAILYGAVLPLKALALAGKEAVRVTVEEWRRKVGN